MYGSREIVLVRYRFYTSKHSKTTQALKSQSFNANFGAWGAWLFSVERDSNDYELMK